MTILRRLVGALLLLLLVASATFLLLHLAPGEPGAQLVDPRVPPSQQARLRAIYGLDRPLGVQYLSWLSAFLRGDLGTSLLYHRPVARVLADALPNTLLLGLAALFLQTAIGLPLGVLAAGLCGGWDRALRGATLALYSLPVFWLALLSTHFFSSVWPLLPAGNLRSVDAAELGALGRAVDLSAHLILPAAVLGLPAAAGLSRYLRNSLLEAGAQGFVLAARARGLSSRRILWVHTLRHAAVPVVQLTGLSLPFLLSGSLVVEVVFSWPGVGRIAYGAVLARDVPLVLAVTTLTGALVVLGNFLADLGHAALDPRLRDA